MGKAKRFLRDAIGQFYVKHSQSLAKLRRAPVIGSFVHYVSHKLLPGDFRTWRQVQAGYGQGLWIKVNPRTASHVVAGRVEEGIQSALREYLRPGMVFYDGGANIGFFTLIAARLIGEQGRVFSFEPDPELANRLKENAAQNHFPWVLVVEAALYSSSGQIRFARSDTTKSPDRGTGKVLEGETSEGALPVRAIALDDFVKKNPPPDLVKLDVEGSEVEALRGASWLLKRHKPIIVCELHSPECDVGVRQILKQHSYRIDRLDQDHILATTSSLA